LVVAMMTWSIWYAVRAFRRSEEWGWALRGEEPPPEVVAAYMPELATSPSPTPTMSTTNPFPSTTSPRGGRSSSG
jgi:hypothetical protein